MYLAGHEVVSVLDFTAPFLLSDVGFRQPTNRRQLLRYLSRLSKESSSIQWSYELVLYGCNVCHRLGEMIYELEVNMKLPQLDSEPILEILFVFVCSSA